MEKKILSKSKKEQNTDDEGLVLNILYPGFIIAVLVYCLIHSM